MSEPHAYPLSWPAARPRTKAAARVEGRFSTTSTEYRSTSLGERYSVRNQRAVSVADARKRLSAELDRLGARYTVLSTNIELRNDGQPYSNRRDPADPGVACYFQLDGQPVVLACDRYTTVGANIAAIAAHIDAMRTAERHGVGSLREMFAGFVALPGAIAPDDWRTILGKPLTLTAAESAYREAMKKAHPDVGGSEAQAAALNTAIAKAREVLK